MSFNKENINEQRAKTFGDEGLLRCVCELIKSQTEINHTLLIYRTNPSKAISYKCSRCEKPPVIVIWERDHWANIFINGFCELHSH